MKKFQEFRKSPYYDYLIFAVTLLVANGLWKWSVQGDDDLGATVTCLGIDCTMFFEGQMRFIAHRVFQYVSFFVSGVSYDGWYSIGLPSGRTMQVVWGCTPIKQIFIWLCLLASARPQSWYKIGYALLGGSLFYGLNIIRITLLTLITNAHFEWFEVFHFYVFKYLFYGVIFLMWLLWVRLIGKYLQNHNSHISV